MQVLELKSGIEADIESLNTAAASEVEDNISQVQQSEITSFGDSSGKL